LLVSYAGLIVQFWRDNLPSRDDIAWTASIVRVLENDEEHVPEVGRFNAGQKFVFWSMALLVPALFLTGLVIWEAYFGKATSIETQRAAALIHSYAAIAAIIIWITHVFAAIWVRGSVRAMTRGYVTPGWAWRHHRKWLRSLVDSGSRGPRPRRAGEGEGS
jgi:formate dehydrogenase subunit gamma